MEIKRRFSRVVKIGNCLIGGNHPVAIQSMTKCKTSQVERAVGQINELAAAGCQIVRLAVKDTADAQALKKIKAQTKLPLVADIHFSYQLALSAIEHGADKIRLNPGNIDQPREIKIVVAALKAAKIPLRIGLNSGSVKALPGKKTLMADKLVTTCLNYVKIIEQLKFNDIVISLKANNVLETVEVYRKIAKVCDYPLHLGLTATGAASQGIIKSSIALGALLLEGIGDTMRVSLTAHPREEVRVAKSMLIALGLRSGGVQLISCPTCGRCEVNLVGIVKKLEKEIALLGNLAQQDNFKVAVMGCVVNGPGEAKEADLGIAFGKNQGLLFKQGKSIRKVAAADCVRALLAEIKQAMRYSNPRR